MFDNITYHLSKVICRVLRCRDPSMNALGPLDPSGTAVAHGHLSKVCPDVRHPVVKDRSNPRCQVVLHHRIVCEVVGPLVDYQNAVVVEVQNTCRQKVSTALHIHLIGYEVRLLVETIFLRF